MTCDYEKIYSRFYRLVNDPKFFDLEESYAYELMCMGKICGSSFKRSMY